MPHYAQLLARIAKDVIPRDQTMKGKRVRRVWGWDCHGLPIEEKVEEKIGLKNRRDIEKYGVISKEHNLVKLLEVLYLQGYPELKKYKSLCRDLKDFYFSRRYASDDYEILTHEEYIDYINNFYELLNKLKRIRSEFE